MQKGTKFNPARMLVFGFLFLILIGTFLLSLPIATIGDRLSLLDALFTATSAVCVTGLVVVDTGTTFTVFGQTVIMILIQMGGLGFMTAATLIFLVIGRKITLKERIVIQESLNQFDLQGVVRLLTLHTHKCVGFLGSLPSSIHFCFGQLPS